MLKPDANVLAEMLNAKRNEMTPEEIENAERIINNNEVNSFSKLFKNLSK